MELKRKRNKTLALATLLVAPIMALSTPPLLNFYLDKNSTIISSDNLIYIFNKRLHSPTLMTYTLSREQVNKTLNYRIRFHSNNKIPLELQGDYKDYRYSGYDRGHLASDASFDYSIYRLATAYAYTAIVPMVPSVNRVSWYHLEQKERKIANKYGGAMVFNVMYYEDNKTIGKHKIAVPTRMEKDIYPLPNGEPQCYSVKNIKNAVETKIPCTIKYLPTKK